MPIIRSLVALRQGNQFNAVLPGLLPGPLSDVDMPNFLDLSLFLDLTIMHCGVYFASVAFVLRLTCPDYLGFHLLLLISAPGVADTFLIQPVLLWASSFVVSIALMSRLAHCIDICFDLRLLLRPGSTISKVYLPTYS